MGMRRETGNGASTHDLAPSLPTSLDVARRAGVSQSTVSLVFGGKATGRVSQRKQEAILQAASELGYRPNQVARTLRSGRSRLVILAVPDVSNPLFASVLQGAEQAARKHHYSVMLASVRDEHDWREVILDALQSQAVDGCLLHTMPFVPLQQDAPLWGKTVLVDTSYPSYPSLQLDLRAGVHAAMTHLFSLGHTRIAHLAAAVDMETFFLRHSAYLAELETAGLAASAAYHEHAPFLLDEASTAAHRLLTCSDPPSAILCDSDVLAVGVYKAANSLHRRIPQDLSVVSFDDSIIARMLEPELTTVAIPTTTIGEQAFLLLLSLLEGKNMPSPVIIPLELVFRASTAAPCAT